MFLEGQQIKYELYSILQSSLVPRHPSRPELDFTAM